LGLVLTANIACRSVVADSILVQHGRGAIDLHVGATVNGNAANLGGSLPKHLGQVANAVEDIFGNVSHFSKVRLHRWELALIPALCDAGGDVERFSRDSEEILALVSSWREVVRKVACLSSNKGIGFAGGVPRQRCSTVVRASSIVMVQHCGLIFTSRGQVCLLGAGLMNCIGRA
jgi:hypothetical protein